jgi:hypothetical protein
VSASTQNSDDFWNVVALLIVAWWWLAPIALGILAAIYEFTHEILKTHHRRKLAIERQRAKAARAEAEAHQALMGLRYIPPAAIEPGPCKHRSDVRPVFEAATGKRVAWYCTTCETQLPATYAVSPEDL